MPIAIKTRQRAEQTLKTVGKLNVRTVQGTVRTASRTIKTTRREAAHQEDNSLSYAANKVSDTGQASARKLDRNGRRAVRSSGRTVRRVIDARRDSAKEQAARKSGMEAVSAGRGYSRRSAGAASGRGAARRQAIQQTRKQETHTVKGALKQIGNAFRAMGKAGRTILSAFNFAIAGGWVVAILIILIAAMGAIQIFSLTTAAPAQNEYPISTAIYYYLRTEVGLNSAAACGVMANIEAESGSTFNLTAIGDNGTSFGLCQWHLSRWDRLNSFCADIGESPASLSGQMRYLKWELENCYPVLMELLKNVDDDVVGCYDAAYNFCVQFERPDAAEIKGNDRALNALQTYWPHYGLNEANGTWTLQGMALALTAFNELNNGGEKYWTWYGFNSHVEWCAIFVSWCAAQRGYIAEGIMPLCASVDSPTNGYAWYYFHGESFAAAPDITPAPGWVAFFKRGHTGIVYDCTAEYVYLIERSTGDIVRLNEYPLETVGEILWWSVPPYTW